MNYEKELAEAVATKLEALKQQLQGAAAAGTKLVYTNDIEEVALVQQLAGRFVASTGETEQPMFGVSKPKHYIEFDWNA